MAKKNTVLIHNSPHIITIKVEELFGLYSYELSLENKSQNKSPEISFLYGDNGSGKTTILSLLFHILSPSLILGHRTYIANVPFMS